ncbi:hypothetical protein HIM_09363 [Hirsutella minnesotensis 3608]|uniref:Sterigmatocystin biosynthesis monooxygenase stcW n=1 Tax=Hirsutella minnesotensis 3608 TaxID=1043627 RepID=A0A0F7ZLL0_9HYPO|nr:hypothetical protein HIM_09363 [Hirsutella minnesotensis 3608]
MPSQETPKEAAQLPSPYHHEYQPDFDKELAETRRYLAGKPCMKEPRKLRIIAIGAGASSLAFAREVREGRIENAELVLYEKNAGIGGTWWENRYAGCACDIPSHNYQFNWAANPNWSKYYSEAPEIKEYFQTVARKFDLEKYIKLEHEVVKAQWNNDAAKWDLEIKDKTGQLMTDSGDVLVNGGGIINNWKWPNIEGLQTTGILKMHSAVWDEAYDFRGKHVCVIGNGSSGVQITAALGKVVDKMTVVMRSPTWITPGFAPTFAGPGGTNFEYSEEQKKHWRENPEAYTQYRKQVENELNRKQDFFLKGTQLQRAAREFSYREMMKGLAGKPELAKKLIPSFDVGCRRPTPGNGYLETLTQPNVDVSWGTPRRATQSSLVLADGREVRPDVIVCATGFDLSYKPRFPIIGRDGVVLSEYWSPDPKAYMSFGVPNFPNYLHYLGPNTGASHGSLMPAIEQLTAYFSKMVNKLQREAYRSFEPLQRCVDELDAHHQEYVRHSAWASHCTSTFKNGHARGRINLLHGGTRLHYFDMLLDPRWEDFRWETLPGGGLYRYFGNGRSLREEEGGDRTWYLNDTKARL